MHPCTDRICQLGGGYVLEHLALSPAPHTVSNDRTGRMINWELTSVPFPNRRTFQGRIQEFAKGGGVSPSFPLPFPSKLPFSLASPFRIKCPLNHLRCLGSAISSPVGSGAEPPGRKRIWCTLMLTESCWWQSFWIFWVPCLPVKRSKFSIS